MGHAGCCEVQQGRIKGGEVTGSPPLRNYGEKTLMCPSVSVFHISVQWSFNVDQLCKLLTVNWLKIKSKWLLSIFWFYALNSPKNRPDPLGDLTALSQTPIAGSWEREGKGEMEGQGEGREGDGRGIPSEWKSWLRSWSTPRPTD